MSRMSLVACLLLIAATCGATADGGGDNSTAFLPLLAAGAGDPQQQQGAPAPGAPVLIASDSMVAVSSMVSPDCAYTTIDALCEWRLPCGARSAAGCLGGVERIGIGIAIAASLPTTPAASHVHPRPVSPPPPPPAPRHTRAAPMSLVATLLGAGLGTTVSLVSASYAGNNQSAGVVKLKSDPNCAHYLTSSFAGADAVVLATGPISIAAKTQNNDERAGVNLGGPGTPYIANSVDAAALTFKIKPKVSGCLSWLFVFASDEYPEYVGSKYNDEFSLLVNGGWAAAGCLIDWPCGSACPGGRSKLSCRRCDSPDQANSHFASKQQADFFLILPRPPPLPTLAPPGNGVAYLPDGYTTVKISNVNPIKNSY
jgi:hypothetical protein